MADLTFYNSLSRQIEPFEPKHPGKVRMYNCGPTVYKRQHIGNMRRYLFSDFLRRTLELFGYEVRDITNITDVGHLTQDEIDAGEDKLEQEAKKQKKTPQDIANEQLAFFQKDLAALNIEPAHLYPRATQHIPHMQKMIEQLIKNGHAYVTPTGVYFDVQSFPEYGTLSGNTLENISPGRRIEVREEKKHPADFALWKLDSSHLQKWDSPWGVGYPGWHIECSAMSLEYLDNEIDIHTGGEDNRFPHHENEIAQSEGATKIRPFVRTWMHNSHLRLAGAKLAKREGEQITLDTIREKGFSPLAFRLLVFGSHYRSKMDFSWEALQSAAEQLGSIKQLIRRLKEHQPSFSADADAETIESFKTALASDLNTPVALSVFSAYLTKANSTLDASPTSEVTARLWTTLQTMDRVLGIIAPLEAEIAQETIPADIQQLAEAREEARRNKEFAKADELRVEIEAKGYAIEDTPSGPRVIKK